MTKAPVRLERELREIAAVRRLLATDRKHIRQTYRLDGTLEAGDRPQFRGHRPGIRVISRQRRPQLVMAECECRPCLASAIPHPRIRVSAAIHRRRVEIAL